MRLGQPGNALIPRPHSQDRIRLGSSWLPHLNSFTCTLQYMNSKADTLETGSLRMAQIFCRKNKSNYYRLGICTKHTAS